MSARRDKRRQSRWPLAGLTIIAWAALAALIVGVDPAVVKDFPLPNSYLTFLGVFFLAWFFLVTGVCQNARRGLLVSLGLTVFLGLRLLRLGNAVNGLLLLALIGVIDFYFHSRYI